MKRIDNLIKTDIYWGNLKFDTDSHSGLLSYFLAWKPWISILAPTSRIDPHHVTLNYDQNGFYTGLKWINETIACPGEWTDYEEPDWTFDLDHRNRNNFYWLEQWT